MVTPVNINYPEGQSNYRLRGEAVNLTCRTYVGVKPDGDGWEQVWVESTTAEVIKEKMRVRGARKQRAAKANVKFASRAVEPVIKVNTPQMAHAILAGKVEQPKVTRQDNTIQKLKQEINDLLAKLQKI
jgi:hypothetical protein